MESLAQLHPAAQVAAILAAPLALTIWVYFLYRMTKNC